jgi:hypothetical protein
MGSLIVGRSKHLRWSAVSARRDPDLRFSSEAGGTARLAMTGRFLSVARLDHSLIFPGRWWVTSAGPAFDTQRLVGPQTCPLALGGDVLVGWLRHSEPDT